MKTQREVLPEPEENGQVKHQKVRPIIVKFTSYRRRQQVFSAKKNIKGKHVRISENLTKIRQKIFNLARDVVRYKDVWSQDGKIFAKRHDDRVIRARLRNHNATDDDNVDFRSFQKNLHPKLGKLM